jgi:hypothetical protein
MSLAACAERRGVARLTAYRWLRADVLYDKRAAQNRAKRALATAAFEDAEVA